MLCCYAADRLVGQVLGQSGTLPEVFAEIEVSITLLTVCIVVLVCGERGVPHSNKYARQCDCVCFIGSFTCFCARSLASMRCHQFHFLYSQCLPRPFTPQVGFYLLKRLLGVKTADGGKGAKVSKLAKGEILMVNIGSTSTGGKVRTSTVRLRCIRGWQLGGRYC